MNNKQRVHASLEGKPIDRFPVTVLYNQLYFQDHFSELMGQPQWQVQPWLYSSPEEYLAIYSQLISKAPFEMLQPEPAPSHQERENTSFIEKDGAYFRHDRRDGSYLPVLTLSGHARDYVANEIQYVHNRQDIDAIIHVATAEEMLAEGRNDYINQVVSAFGQDHFILSGGVVGTIYSCGSYVGQTNTFAMLLEQPALIEGLCQKITAQNIEIIRTLSAAGGDAIYIDDATATSDMISVSAYERFSLPYMKMMIEEIHRLNHKAIVIYFGGVMDRLEQIVATGADGLACETSMKNYTNPIDLIAKKIGSQVTLFGNIDPLGILQNASNAELDAEIERQFSAGRQARGFILSTGSPITPGTPLSRVQRFLSSKGNKP